MRSPSNEPKTITRFERVQWTPQPKNLENRRPKAANRGKFASRENILGKKSSTKVLQENRSHILRLN